MEQNNDDMFYEETDKQAGQVLREEGLPLISIGSLIGAFIGWIASLLFGGMFSTTTIWNASLFSIIAGGAMGAFLGLLVGSMLSKIASKQAHWTRNHPTTSTKG